MGNVRRVEPSKKQDLKVRLSKQKETAVVHEKKAKTQPLTEIQKRVATQRKKTHATVLAVKKDETLETYADRLWHFAHPIGVNRVLNIIGAYDQWLLIPKNSNSPSDMIDKAKLTTAELAKKRSTPQKELAGR